MQFGNISFYNILEIFKNESFDKITTFSFSYSYSFEPCSMLMVAFFFNTFFAILHSMWDFGSLTRNQSNRHPLQWKLGVLTTGPAAKSPVFPSLRCPPFPSICFLQLWCIRAVLRAGLLVENEAGNPVSEILLPQHPHTSCLVFLLLL